MPPNIPRLSQVENHPRTSFPVPRLPSAESLASSPLRGSASPERRCRPTRSPAAVPPPWTCRQHSISAGEGGGTRPGRLLRRNEAAAWSKMLMITGGRHSSIRRAISSWLAVRVAGLQHRASPNRRPIASAANQAVGSSSRPGQLVGHRFAGVGRRFPRIDAPEGENAIGHVLADLVGDGPLLPLETRLGPQQDRRPRSARAAIAPAGRTAPGRPAGRPRPRRSPASGRRQIASTGGRPHAPLLQALPRPRGPSRRPVLRG